mmetsp:Transcript_44090/g.104971  ORF Transcript_44090/g.104971 Transcript_44090/m.104971 type:complete len:267 (-) Transcript_44090:161-961(-)
MQRSGAHRRAPRQDGGGGDGLRGGGRARDRRPREEGQGPHQGGAHVRRLPRGWARHLRVVPGACRPAPQGLHRPARLRRPRVQPVPAARSSALLHGAAPGHDVHGAGRAGGRGGGVWADHDRGVRRPQPRHQDRLPAGVGVRHEQEGGAALLPGPGRRKSVQETLLGGYGSDDRRGGAADRGQRLPTDNGPRQRQARRTQPPCRKTARPGGSDAHRRAGAPRAAAVRNVGQLQGIRRHQPQVGQPHHPGRTGDESQGGRRRRRGQG